MPRAPTDNTITLPDLIRDPYAIYHRLRHEAPVIRVGAVGRTFLTKAADTRHVKDTPAIFSSNDPNTPMERAFRAHTLMRKDGAAHARERGAMAPAFSAAHIRSHWMPLYERIAAAYVARLPRGETVEFFTGFAGPVAARCLAHLLGLPDVPDRALQHWSQTLIDGAGNFGWQDALFAECDAVNDAVDAEIAAMIPRHRADPGPSALSAMVNADDPISLAQIRSNIKIAIGGGINEPRDALLTALYGLLSHPGQRAELLKNGSWDLAFEEAIRWVAPIQVSSRLVTEDTTIRGCDIPRGETVMTIQASANHDEDLYENGAEFDVFRARTPHQSFGNGPHFCQGIHVARRMVGGILLPLLFDRFPNMELAAPGDVTFTGFGFRGPAALPIRLA